MGTYDKQYYLKNRERRLQQAKDRRAALKQETLDHYGQWCAECGFGDPRALHIDHVDGGGNAHRGKVMGNSRLAGWNFYHWLKKNGFPEGFQTLCANCNAIKQYNVSEVQ